MKVSASTSFRVLTVSVNEIARMTSNARMAENTTVAGLRRHIFSSAMYICTARLWMERALKLTFSPSFFMNWLTAIGMSNRATISESSKVVMMDTPMCSPMSFSRKSSENRKGRNTVMVVSVAAMIALVTSLVPRMAASSLLTPIARNRNMFSMTTTELSKSMPTAKAIPVRVKVLMLISKK